MKWFITCLIVCFIGSAILIGYSLSITIIAVEESLTEKHLANLLIIYNIE